MSETSPVDVATATIPNSLPPNAPAGPTQPTTGSFRFAKPIVAALLCSVGFSVAILLGGYLLNGSSSDIAAQDEEPLAVKSNGRDEKKRGAQPGKGKVSQINADALPSSQPDEKEKKKVAAAELDGGVAWLNTGGPLSLRK